MAEDQGTDGLSMKAVAGEIKRTDLRYIWAVEWADLGNRLDVVLAGNVESHQIPVLGN